MYVRELYYISATDGVVAIIERKNTVNSVYYIHKDHLGSYDVITSQDGTVKQRNSFDPWGRRRNPENWTYDNVPADYFFDRGFTAHEHLDQFGLINMNGRVYDPLMAMFLGPDNYIQAPDLTQNFNRYAYCFYNPLKHTDPSGMGVEDGVGPIHNERWFRDKHRLNDMDGRGVGNYSYDWSTGYYHDGSGSIVSYEEVHYNYIVPNSDFSFSGEIAQDIYRAMTQVSSSTNYTASADGTIGSPSESITSLLPVAFVMEVDLSWEAGFATSMTPGGIGLVLQGRNSGTVFFYSAGGVGGGWFGAAGSLNSAYFFYAGDVNNFSQYSLGGKSTVLSLSAGDGMSFGRSLILMKDNYGGVIIGIGTSIGAGGSPTVGSGQITIQQTHIWP